MPLDRGFCFFLHTYVRTHTRTHTDALHKNVFACVNKGTQALLHTSLFTLKNLRAEQFLQKKIDTEKLVHTDCAVSFAHRNFHTQPQKLYPEQILHTIYFPHRNIYARKSLRTTIFTHRRFLHIFSAQKSYTQKFTHNNLCTQTFLHTDAFTQTNFDTHTHTHCQYTHTHKLCTQHAFTHNQLLHREALFPLLDHYLTCSRSQVMLIVIYIDVKKKSPFLRYCASQSGHEKVLFPLLERTWELRVPTEKPKRLGKWLGMAGPCKDRRRYDEPHI